MQRRAEPVGEIYPNSVAGQTNAQFREVRRAASDISLYLMRPAPAVSRRKSSISA
jgi:hypothetical protein